MGLFFLEIASMTATRLKKEFKAFGKTVGSPLGGGTRFKNLLKGLKPSLGTSLGKEVEVVEKPPKSSLKEEILTLRRNFSHPRPEITLFHLEEGRFRPYSTSEDEEKRDDSFYSSLASIDSAGRNIVKALTRTASSVEVFSLEDREIYSFLPAGDETLCFGRIEGAWLFLIRSRRFTEDRLLPPDTTVEEAYSFEGLKVFVDPKLDLLLKKQRERAEKAVYSLLADSFKIAYRSTLKNQRLGMVEGKGQSVAIYLIQTPQSRLSPFLLIRLEKDEDLIARIFPIWVNYEENKLLRTAKRIKRTHRSLASPGEAPPEEASLHFLHAFENLKRDIGEERILLAIQRFIQTPNSIFIFETEQNPRLFSSFLDGLIGSIEIKGDVKDLLDRRLAEYETMSRGEYETSEVDKARAYFVKEVAAKREIGETLEKKLERLKDSPAKEQLEILQDVVIRLAVDQFAGGS